MTLRPRRILIFVEGADGDHLGVELTSGALDRLGYEMEAWPVSGTTYLGEGNWSSLNEAWIRFSATGVYEVQRVANPAGWLAERAGNPPEQANNVVYGHRSLSTGQDGR